MQWADLNMKYITYITFTSIKCVRIEHIGPNKNVPPSASVVSKLSNTLYKWFSTMVSRHMSLVCCQKIPILYEQCLEHEYPIKNNLHFEVSSLYNLDHFIVFNLKMCVTASKWLCIFKPPQEIF